MIILFHSIFYVGRAIFQILLDNLFGRPYFYSELEPQLDPQDYRFKSYYFSKRTVQELKQYDSKELKCIFDENSGLKFFPPVYAQRYNTVKETIVKYSAKYEITKVVDMGCAELNFFPFLKNVPGVEEIIALDVDSQLLESMQHRSAPLLADYLAHRESPLHVLVLSGNITQHDHRLLDCNVVIAIELIEHLYPQELEEFPFTVFGFIQPNIAIVTTPNFDFNILFHRMRGFRHPDHKFEWTREQFRDWAINITKRYPDYEVTIQGIGDGPFGSEFLGCCSQMAIFTRITPKKDSNVDQKAEERIKENNKISSNQLRNLDIYNLIAQYDYPVYKDNRTGAQKIQDDLSCTIHNLARKEFERKWNQMHSSNEDFTYEEYDDHIYVSFEDIIKSMDETKLTESELSQLLDGTEWNVKEIDGKLVVHYPDESSSSCPEDGEDADEQVAEECKGELEADSDWEKDEADKCAIVMENDSDWEGIVAGEKEYSSWPQNISPSPSCISDWNEEDTQTKALVDSGYPNSFSGHDKDIANSIDLHGSSLEEDSGDEMEDDINSSIDAEAVEQEEIHPQNEDMDNQIHLNAAANPDVFYEVIANQDENQDLVNNNRDNEGNNAEPVFEEEPAEDAQNLVEASESEESIMEYPSEDESESEDQKLRMKGEDNHSRVDGQMDVEDGIISPNTLWLGKEFPKEIQEASEDQPEGLTLPMSEEVNREMKDPGDEANLKDEGFAEAVSSKITLASEDIAQITLSREH